MFFCGVDKLGPKQIIRMLHIDYGGNQLFEEFRPNNLGNAEFLKNFRHGYVPNRLYQTLVNGPHQSLLDKYFPLSNNLCRRHLWFPHSKK